MAYSCCACCRFGAAAWIAVGAAILEFLIVFKFALLKYSHMTMPDWVRLFWILTSVCFVTAAGWWFFIGRRVYAVKDKQE